MSVISLTSIETLVYTAWTSCTAKVEAKTIPWKNELSTFYLSEASDLCNLVIHWFCKDHSTMVTIKGLNCPVRLDQNFSIGHKEIVGLLFRVGSTVSVKWFPEFYLDSLRCKTAGTLLTLKRHGKIHRIFNIWRGKNTFKHKYLFQHPVANAQHSAWRFTCSAPIKYILMEVA